MTPRFLRLIVLAIVVALFFVGPTILALYTDWLWFGEVGYQQIFSTMLRAQGTMFTIVFAVAALWLAFNLNAALANIGDARPVFTTREGFEVVLPGRQQLRTIALGIAVVVAVLLGLYASGRWLTWLSWRHAVRFDQADPVLGNDVAFYVF